MDVQHRRITAYLEQLRTFTRDSSDERRVRATLADFVQFLHIHFADEEQFMATHGYPGIFDHAETHTAMFARVSEIERRHRESSLGITEALLDDLYAIFEEHIINQDRPYGVYFQRQRETGQCSQSLENGPDRVAALELSIDR